MPFPVPCRALLPAPGLAISCSAAAAQATLEPAATENGQQIFIGSEEFA